MPIQNLNPDVLMMESAEYRYCCDAPNLLRRPKIWSIFLPGEMGPDPIIIGAKPALMPPDHDVIWD